MTRTAGVAVLVVAAACGSPGKVPDRPCADVPRPALDGAVAAPAIVDAAAIEPDGALVPDVPDAGATVAPAIDASVPESPDMLRARVAALEMKTTSIGADPVPKPIAEPPSPPRPGRIEGSRRVPAPVLYRGKPMRMSDGLPPEVIARIVRQNYGRFRLCFEAGYRSNPSLTKQSVTVRFAVAANGETVLTDPASTTADASTTLCVVRGFQNLSYPQPTVPLVAVELTVSVVFPE